MSDERDNAAERLAALKGEGLSLRAMARQLGRAASTISRELRRNGGLDRYRAAAADRRAWHRALRER